jgi:hypothetical protein
MEPGAAGKDAHSEPYATLVERLRTSLRKASALVVIGYSFRDLHVKTIVTEAMSENKRLRLVVVDPFPLAMFEASDRLAASRASFAELRAQIHPIPLGAAEALQTHEVRESIPSAMHVAQLEAEWYEVRRRGNRQTVLS